MGGDDITDMPQAARTQRGLGRTFQITSLFKSLPALDNVALGIAEREGVALSMWKPASGYKATATRRCRISRRWASLMKR